MAQVLLPPLLAAVLLVGGACSVDSPPTASERVPRSATASDTAVPPSPASPSPSARESTREPDQKQGADGKGRGGGKMEPPTGPVGRAPGAARSHLLTEDTLPTTGSGSSWTAVETRQERDPVGACQRASLVDIGALRAVVRVFEGPDGSGLRSRQVVARFADRKSAWRAHEVLRTWRDDCEEVLDDPAEVGPMVDVELATSTGAHYRADHGPKKDADHTGLGIVRHRGWISIVDISATESDYPSTWTRRAVRRIAATF